MRMVHIWFPWFGVVANGNCLTSAMDRSNVLWLSVYSPFDNLFFMRQTHALHLLLLSSLRASSLAQSDRMFWWRGIEFEFESDFESSSECDVHDSWFRSGRQRGNRDHGGRY